MDHQARDLESGASGARLLSKRSPDQIRSGFIRKVYGIVMAQLLLTALLAGAIRFVLPEALVARMLEPALLVSSVGLLVLTGAMSAWPEAMRKSPQNYLMLLAFTVLESVLLGIICCAFEASAVLSAAGTTVGLFACLTLFACTTKIDFTGLGGLLLSCLLGLTATGLLLLLVPAKMALWTGFGALLFCAYIVFDTQLIVGGEHKQGQFAIDDYACAALHIYLDIINLFIKLLELMNDKKKSKK